MAEEIAAGPSAMERDLKRLKDGKTPIITGHDTSDAEIVLRMMDKIMSNDNMEQKSRLIFENIRAMCQAEVLIDSLVNGVNFMQLPEVDGIQFIDPSLVHTLDEFKDLPEFKNREERASILSGLSILCKKMTAGVVSLDGLGRNELIQLAHAFNFQIQQHQHEQGLMDKMILGGQIRGR